MAYSRGAVERAMKVQEVILRAIDGKLTWVQAADILGYSPRTIRRIRWRLRHFGYDGLLDRRRQIAFAEARPGRRGATPAGPLSRAVPGLQRPTFSPAPAANTACAFAMPL